MVDMLPGVTKNDEAFDGVVWNILGQTYTLKQESDSSMAWHAVFPPGTFVPPHVHPTQDEFVYIFDGRLDLVLNGEKATATAGDVIRMPMGIPHGLFNNSAGTVKCFFWVSPTAKLRGCSNASTISAIRPKSFALPPNTRFISFRHKAECHACNAMSGGEETAANPAEFIRPRPKSRHQGGHGRA